MFKALKCDLNKTVVNTGFLGAVFLTMILCFTANIYEDSATSKTYSVMETIMSLDRSIITQDYTLSSAVVFSKCFSGYIGMFIPIIVAFPFMVTFCAERNSGLMRFTITRTGKFKYSISKFLACFLSGGLAVFLGTLLFGLAVMIIFPSVSSYDFADDIQKELFEIMFPNGVFLSCVKTLISAFLYGAISTMPAFFLSSFCKNPYIITCLPFLFIYIWNTTLDKITNSMFTNGNFKKMEKIYSFYPDSITSVISYEFDKTAKISLIFNISYVLILLFGFVLIMNMRKDKGA